MKLNILKLTSLLILITSTAYAGYDEFNCRERDMLKGLGLQCISCGVQQYYADKGHNGEVVPSEKWIALLAVNARAFRVLKSESLGRSNGYSSAEMDNMRKVVIAQIQAYGFCTRYVSNDTLKVTSQSPRPKPFQDLSGEDWASIKEFINRDHDQSEMNDVAKKFGFKQSTVLGIETGGNTALENMKFLFDDHEMDAMTVAQKRTEFKKKLNSVLSSGYDVSGEKTDKKEIFGLDEKDQGLKQCMEEVQKRINSPEYSKDNSDMCKAMINSCDMNLSFCNGSPVTPIGAGSAPTGGTLPPLPSDVVGSKKTGGVR